MRKTWSLSSSSVKSSNSQKARGLFRRQKKTKDSSRSPTPDLEPPPSPSFPVLPPEIHHRLLEFLSVENLFYMRGVNRWYHEACLEHINRRYKNSRALISAAFCQVATHRRSDPISFSPSPEPGNHLLKWSIQNLTFTESICRGYLWIIFPGDEVRGTMIRFADCNEKVRKKFIANRVQKMTSWESQELLQYRSLSIEGYYQRDATLNAPKDRREKAGLRCFENTWNWELYMPVYKLLAVKGV